ncbi:TssA family type VI secretion system protein [Legionella londiniensis]|uniref:ImpA N-terminal domain-containing protein n=1 Tax=Legionella londiniensis TaxID=45068 RepID=A0A0W0VSK0_9GAMM|nr:TssA family type VI secretion system protein [Legionella londiniensis]KTD23048.1 hypothetical protein Llon_0282 [Legionella londiniensis]STX94065.1 Uncharacterized protein conserved in bacteria [Legionella londiniensis]
MDAKLAELWQWIEPCLKPFTHAPCGSDPCYQDDFEQIKLEIEKLSHCNFPLIKKLSHALLSNFCKDLRLAGYLTLALIQEHQVAGLIVSLRFYKRLLEQFAATVHPQNPRARHAALAWLNNSRFNSFLSASTALKREEIEIIEQTIHDFNIAIRTCLGDDCQLFTCLDAWYRNLVPVTTEKNDEGSLKTNLPENDRFSLKDAKQAHEMQRLVIDFWLNEKQWLLGCQLARAWRWGEMRIPKQTGGKTHIHPPRKEALVCLEKLHEQAHPERLLTHCEHMFLEPGGSYFLDLQWHASQAASWMQEPGLAEFLLTQTRWLCRQFPVLLELHFSNGLSFASNQTRLWLTEAKARAQNTAAKTAAAFRQQAIKNAQKTDLASLLRELEKITPKNAEESLSLLQAKGYFCWQEKRIDLAYIFYQELAAKVEQLGMATWIPDKALSIWQEIFNFLNSIHSHKLSSDQERLKTEVQRKICLQNSSGACALPSS